MGGARKQGSSGRGALRKQGHSVKGYLDFYLGGRKNGARLELLGEK